MKHYILGLITAAIVLIPAGTYAAIQGLPDANVIYQYDLGGGRVEVFDDQDNKCYIAHYHYSSDVSISCVKGAER